MNRTFAIPAMMAFLLSTSGASAACAQSEQQLADEIEALKAGQDQIRKDLAEIKSLLQPRAQRPSGPNVLNKIFNLGDNPVQGASTAKLTLVEFTDYQ